MFGEACIIVKWVQLARQAVVLEMSEISQDSGGTAAIVLGKALVRGLLSQVPLPFPRGIRTIISRHQDCFLDRI
jgi:hypothetical protein